MISHSKPYLEDIDKSALIDVFNGGMISKGEKVQLFEKGIAEYSGYKYAKSTASGASALMLILNSLRIKEGDEVILPTYVCDSVYKAIEFTGAKPILCDISGPWIMTYKDVIKYVTKKTKAIILVHMYGINASDYKYNMLKIPIINDYCQSFGNFNKDNHRHNLGFCSFQATKCLTTGEGGMCLINCNEISEFIADNSKVYGKLSNIAANLGLIQLKKYSKAQIKREEIARYYKNNITIYSKTEEFINGKSENFKSMFFRFPLIVKNPPENIIKKIKNNYDICIRRGVDKLLHEGRNMMYSCAEYVYNSTISIPIYPSLKKNELSYIVHAINEELA